MTELLQGVEAFSAMVGFIAVVILPGVIARRSYDRNR